MELSALENKFDQELVQTQQAQSDPISEKLKHISFNRDSNDLITESSQALANHNNSSKASETFSKINGYKSNNEALVNQSNNSNNNNNSSNRLHSMGLNNQSQVID